MRHIQIAIGLPDPKEFSSKPRLKLIQSGIHRYTSEQYTKAVKIGLHITPIILPKIQDYWLPKQQNQVLLAAAVICSWLLCSKEITVPSVSSFNSSSHLSWGNMSLDNVLKPTTLRIHLKYKPIKREIYVGRASCLLCPVGAGCTICLSEVLTPVHFLSSSMVSFSQKANLYNTYQMFFKSWVSPTMRLLGTSSRLGLLQQQHRLEWRKSKRWSSESFNSVFLLVTLVLKSVFSLNRVFWPKALA